MALKETPHVAGGVTTYHKDGYALNLTDSSTHDDILPWEEEQRRINWYAVIIQDLVVESTRASLNGKGKASPSPTFPSFGPET